MDRKNFIKVCGLACMGGSAIAGLLESCGSSKIIAADIHKDDLIVPLNSFETGKSSFKNYIIVQNELLQYPICIYRNSATAYTALWMRCTHQGAELQVFGAKLQCPAHGSEFNADGSLRTGPADRQLRSFQIKVEGHQLRISLKAI